MWVLLVQAVANPSHNSKVVAGKAYIGHNNVAGTVSPVPGLDWK